MMLTTANPSALPPVRKKRNTRRGPLQRMQPERKTRREEHKAGKERERERERERNTHPHLPVAEDTVEKFAKRLPHTSAR
jgi:hypothetical protein